MAQDDLTTNNTPDSSTNLKIPKRSSKGVVSNDPTDTTPTTEDTKEGNNAYTFTSREKELYGSYSLDTHFARAWSRLLRQGTNVGPPIAEIQEYPDDNEKYQDFRLAYATMDTTEDNKNEVVQFFDARGLIAEESGI